MNRVQVVTAVSGETRFVTSTEFRTDTDLRRGHLAVAAITFGEISNETGSAAVAVAFELPRTGRRSLRDLRSLLGKRGTEAAAAEREMLNLQMKKQLDHGDITPLHFYRCVARITQEQLAAATRSRQSYVSQIETGRRPLTWRQAKKFASVLGVTPDQLLEYKK